jgi:hypothetical protein
MMWATSPAWLTEVSANPRRVLADIELLWPPGNTLFPVHVRKSTVVDVVPGSALEQAYGGPGNLQTVTADLGSADTLSKAWLAN